MRRSAQATSERHGSPAEGGPSPDSTTRAAGRKQAATLRTRSADITLVVGDFGDWLTLPNGCAPRSNTGGGTFSLAGRRRPPLCATEPRADIVEESRCAGVRPRASDATSSRSSSSIRAICGDGTWSMGNCHSVAVGVPARGSARAEDIHHQQVTDGPGCQSMPTKRAGSGRRGATVRAGNRT